MHIMAYVAEAADHRTKVTGSKRAGYRATCQDCTWLDLGTYELHRKDVERNAEEHKVLARRRDAFRALDAGEITPEEWDARMDDIQVALDAL